MVEDNKIESGKLEQGASLNNISISFDSNLSKDSFPKRISDENCAFSVFIG